MPKVFIYATLKSRRILTEALGERHGKELRRAALQGYSEEILATDGDHWPTLVPSDTAIPGDIIIVTQAELTKLDAWESHYHRRLVVTTLGPAWTYIFQPRPKYDAWKDSIRNAEDGSLIKELPPIFESKADYDQIEKRIRETFKRLVYEPMLSALQLPNATLQNARENALLEALRSGRVTYSRGVFSGRFNAAVSKALRDLGATWDRKTATFKLRESSLTDDVRHAVATSEARFQEALASIDKHLAQILPAEIAGNVNVTPLFDRAIWKVEKEFHKTMSAITIVPELSPERRERIAAEWQDNMDLWIKDFAAAEIKRLRQDVKEAIFAGNRYQALVKTIQKSYGVTTRKAKFLARQETGLLMAKFKETRYADAGVMEYRWGCVAGSKAHPVRPAHKALEGKVFRWDDPPITTSPHEAPRRNNPGQDYNCRCFARPIVRFRKETS